MAKKKKVEKKVKHSGEKVEANLAEERVFVKDSEKSRNLYDTGRFGEPSGKNFQYSLIEALYLLEKEKIIILDGRNKPIYQDKFIKKARKIEPNFWIDIKYIKT